jgi:hypothetical protein
MSNSPGLLEAVRCLLEHVAWPRIAASFRDPFSNRGGRAEEPLLRQVRTKQQNRVRVWDRASPVS